jgi:hypothetical protein
MPVYFRTIPIKIAKYGNMLPGTSDTVSITAVDSGRLLIVYTGTTSATCKKFAKEVDNLITKYNMEAKARATKPAKTKKPTVETQLKDWAKAKDSQKKVDGKSSTKKK